jgi:AraC family transcriptional regulator
MKNDAELRGNSMTLYIKNMVCPRCIMSVESILRAQALPYHSVKLGAVELEKEPGKTARAALAKALEEMGFELLDDQRKQLIEQVKNLLIQKVQGGDIEEHFSISKYLSKKLYKDYSQLSKLFTEVEGITVEQYFILQKIEKVKEWLVYDTHSIGTIALELGYSSVQHLSAQFKKITGMTPSAFKKVGAGLRRSLDSI